jgi:hypothetical protein
VAAFPLPHAIGHNATSPSWPASHPLLYQNSTIGVGSVSVVFNFFNFLGAHKGGASQTNIRYLAYMWQSYEPK